VVNTENWTFEFNASYAASRMIVTKVSDQSAEVLITGGNPIGNFATVGK
jgi:hypothetical protein